MPEKPWSEACERNREPILGVLRSAFAAATQVLEIGAGTGQHAAYFAAALPHLAWQPTDRAEHLPGIAAWRDAADLANLRAPLELNVDAESWPVVAVEAVFSANTLHIMGWSSVCLFSAASGVCCSLAACLRSTGHSTMAGNTPRLPMPVSMNG